MRGMKASILHCQCGRAVEWMLTVKDMMVDETRYHCRTDMLGIVLSDGVVRWTLQIFFRESAIQTSAWVMLNVI